MISEELILKYADKNYDLVIDNYSNITKFYVYDLISGREFGRTEDFIFSFNKIIPCENLSDILTEWYNIKCEAKNKIISDYLKFLKYTKGINLLQIEIKEKFKYDETFNRSSKFLENKVNELYMLNYIEPKLNRFYKKMNSSLSSNNWVSKFSNRIYKKNDYVKTQIQKEIIQYYRDNILSNKLKTFLESMNLSLGSIVLYEELINTMIGDLENYQGYIMNSFDNYYQKNHLDNVIKKYINTLNPQMNSLYIVNNFKELSIEMETHYDYCVDKVNEWYGEIALKDKIQDILSQLIITLGTRDWEVTWIGHGKLNENNLYSSFKEHEYHKTYILKKYDEWYDVAVIEASEREVLKNNGTWR